MFGGVWFWQERCFWQDLPVKLTHGHCLGCFSDLFGILIACHLPSLSRLFTIAE
jgi:hypothetical protein